MLAANAGDGRTSSGELLEVDQAEPFSVYLETQDGGHLVLDGLSEVAGPGIGRAELAITSAEPLRGYVLGLADGDGRSVAVAGPLYVGDDLPKMSCPWVRLSAAPAEATARGIWLAVTAAHPELKGQVGWVPSPAHRGSGRASSAALAALPHVQVIVVSFPKEVARRQLGTGWAALVGYRPQLRKPPGLAEVVRIERAGRTDLLRRAPELDAVVEASVLVVGGGGLGSALLQELARVPLLQLAIVDGDTVDAATAIRFPSAFRFANRPKAESLAQLVAETQPYTRVKVSRGRVGFPRVADVAAVGTGGAFEGSADQDQHALLVGLVAEIESR